MTQSPARCATAWANRYQNPPTSSDFSTLRCLRVMRSPPSASTAGSSVSAAITMTPTYSAAE